MKKKRKRIKNFTPKKRVLIVCEGDTEENYFNGLKVSPSFRKNNTIKLEVENPKKNDAIGLVKCTLKISNDAKKEKNPFEKTWVILDKDKHANLSEAFNLARREKLHIAFSSISFEYWFLLHFDKIRKPFETSDQLIKDLKSRFWRDFHKTKINHF